MWLICNDHELQVAYVRNAGHCSPITSGGLHSARYLCKGHTLQVLACACLLGTRHSSETSDVYLQMRVHWMQRWWCFGSREALFLLTAEQSESLWSWLLSSDPWVRAFHIHISGYFIELEPNGENHFGGLEFKESSKNLFSARSGWVSTMTEYEDMGKLVFKGPPLNPSSHVVSKSPKRLTHPCSAEDTPMVCPLVSVPCVHARCCLLAIYKHGAHPASPAISWHSIGPHIHSRCYLVEAAECCFELASTGLKP